MAKKQKLVNVDCGHCGKAAVLRCVSEHRDVHRYFNTAGDKWDEGSLYKICLCPSCSKISLVVQFIDTRTSLSGLAENVLYPSPFIVPQGLPQPVKRAYDAAAKVRAIDTNAYAVLLGRVLEMVVENRKAHGNSLNEKIKYLATKGEIPEQLSEIARRLRHMRNFGAHAGSGELTTDEVPLLDDLCRAILEYVYTAPLLLARAEKHLSKLRSSGSK
jgi:hypothetical protein